VYKNAEGGRGVCRLGCEFCWCGSSRSPEQIADSLVSGQWSVVSRIYFIFGFASPKLSIYLVTRPLSARFLSPLHPPTIDPSTAAPRPAKSIQILFVRRAMVRPAVTRVVKRAFKQSRGLHSRPLGHESSISYLLDQGPKDSEKVIVNGFIRSIRNQKQRSFASVGDGSSLEPLQALLTPKQSEGSELPPSFHIPSNSNQTAGQALQWHSCTAHGLMATLSEPQGAKPRASCRAGGCYRILRPCRM
jgi:hypothetical protein